MVGVILLVRPHYNPHPHNITQNDDVTKLTSAAWTEPDPRRVIVGGPNGKMLCVLTATVRPLTTDEQGSGSGEDDSRVDESLMRFRHFIFRNRMQISQHC